MVLLDMVQDDNTPTAHREPGTIINLDVANGHINITVSADGTVTATHNGNPEDARAFAAITGDNPHNHWADHLAAGLTEAFQSIPLTATEGIATVVQVALTAHRGIGTRASNSNGRAPIVCLHHPDPEERRSACGEFGWPWTPIAAHHAATSTDPVLIDRIVGIHPEAGPIAATNPNVNARAAAARRCAATDIHLFSDDPDPTIRAAAAKNDAVPDDVLRSLATDDDKAVVAAVRTRPDAATGAAADILFGAGARSLTEQIDEARKKPLGGLDGGAGVLDYAGTTWMFAATSKESSTFHLVAEDPEGTGASQMRQPHYGSYVSSVSTELFPGAWAETSACGRAWQIAVPHDVRRVMSPCKTCLSRVAGGA